MILVLGATGFVGRVLVDALRSDGEQVRAATRRLENARRSPGIDWVRCDLRQPETLAPALDGVSCIYYLVHSMGNGRHPFRQVERESAEALAREAAAAGCTRIVYLGGVAPEGKRSEHLASRIDVGEILRGGRVPTVELRAAMIVGHGGASWQIVRDLALRLPLMILPRWLESRSCPIALEDVTTALLDARRVPIHASDWFDVPGPDVLSAREMLETVAALRGRRVPMLRVPILTPRLSALWLRFVTDADRDIARELVLGLTEDLLPRDARYWQLTGHSPTCSFEAAARTALEVERSTPRPGRRFAWWEEQLVDIVGPRRAPQPSRPHRTSEE
ncbi:MAG: NAD(P)H-binding protein [Myxococcota bacterium]|nr:NAD(P)H-binding protein [Myxococcota bacterium]